MDKAEFYQAIRAPLFGGHLAQTQVDGLELLLDQGGQEALDSRQLAYVLATVHHETDHTMQPIREYGLGHGRPYGVPDPVTGQTYYGRGYVQLTWKRNYQTMSDKLGVDLVAHPDRALDPAIAVRVIFLGMMQGLFTGRKLGTYFDAAHSDWYNARMVINGLDRADLIQGYALSYYKALIRSEHPQLALPHRSAIASLRLQPAENGPGYVDLERASLLA